MILLVGRRQSEAGDFPSCVICVELVPSVAQFLGPDPIDEEAKLEAGQALVFAINGFKCVHRKLCRPAEQTIPGCKAKLVAGQAPFFAEMRHHHELSQRPILLHRSDYNQQLENNNPANLVVDAGCGTVHTLCWVFVLLIDLVERLAPAAQVWPQPAAQEQESVPGGGRGQRDRLPDAHRRGHCSIAQPVPDPRLWPSPAAAGRRRPRNEVSRGLNIFYSPEQSVHAVSAHACVAGSASPRCLAAGPSLLAPCHSVPSVREDSCQPVSIIPDPDAHAASRFGLMRAASWTCI